MTAAPARAASAARGRTADRGVARGRWWRWWRRGRAASHRGGLVLLRVDARTARPDAARRKSARTPRGRPFAIAPPESAPLGRQVARIGHAGRRARARFDRRRSARHCAPLPLRRGETQRHRELDALRPVAARSECCEQTASSRAQGVYHARDETTSWRERRSSGAGLGVEYGVRRRVRPGGEPFVVEVPWEQAGRIRHRRANEPYLPVRNARRASFKEAGGVEEEFARWKRGAPDALRRRPRQPPRAQSHRRRGRHAGARRAAPPSSTTKKPGRRLSWPTAARSTRRRRRAARPSTIERDARFRTRRIQPRSRSCRRSRS